MFGSQPPPLPPPHGWSQATTGPASSGSARVACAPAHAHVEDLTTQQLWGPPAVHLQSQQQQRHDLYAAPPVEPRRQPAFSSAGTYWQAPPPHDYAYLGSATYVAEPLPAPLAHAYPSTSVQHSASYAVAYDTRRHYTPPPPMTNAVASSSQSKQTLEQRLADEHRELHGEIAAQHDAELRALRQRQAQWSHQTATGGHGILFGSTSAPGSVGPSSGSLPIDQFQPVPPFHAVWGGLSHSIYQPPPPPRGGAWLHQQSPSEPIYSTPLSALDASPVANRPLDPSQPAYVTAPHLVPPLAQAVFPSSPSTFDNGRPASSSDSLSPNPHLTFNLEPPRAQVLPPTAPSTGDSSRAPPLLQVTAPGPSRSISPRHGKAARTSTRPSPSPPYDTPPKSPPAGTPAPKNKSAAARTLTGSVSGPSAARRKRSLCPNLPVARCGDCNAPVAHLLLRGEDEDFAVEWEGHWLCHPCMGIRREKGLGGVAKEATGSLRKRKRKAQDLQGLVICDVCLKVKGQGGVVPLDGQSPIRFTTEFVCVSCDDKYKRCSDCGGGGGGRIGIGKWRSKQLFTGQRKTCCLTHTRIGEAALSFGVWDVRDFKSLATREALLEKCSARWRDRTLARLATPEVLESAVGPARTYEDVEAALAGGWPSREAIFEGIETPIEHEKRRFFGLTWCKTKPRRKYASDKSESPTGDKAVLDERANHDDIIPPDHDLVGLFIGHWRINDGTLLLTTSLPFETSDGDDRAATAVGEMCVKITAEIYDENQRRLAAHEANSFRGPLKLLPPLEHLWVLCDNPDSRTQERMRDHLVRRRDFLPLEDYLKIHPHVDRSIFRITTCYMPVSGPSWIFGGEEIDPAAKKERQCDILVRWLGPQIDQRWVEDLSTGTDPLVPSLG